MNVIFAMAYIQSKASIAPLLTAYMVYLTVTLIWRFGESHKDRQINCMHYQAIYTASMQY